MKHSKTFTIKLGSLHASVFVASRLQRAHGLQPLALYVHYRNRVRVQWPRRKNMAKPYDTDLPRSEILRTWSGLTVGDRGCDPNYRAMKNFQDIEQEPEFRCNKGVRMMAYRERALSTHKPKKSWAQIAQENPSDHYAREQAARTALG